MATKVNLRAISSAVPGQKKDPKTGALVNYTSDGHVHKLVRIYPCPAPDSVTDRASLIQAVTDFYDQNEAVMKTLNAGKVKVKGQCLVGEGANLAQQDLDISISSPPFDPAMSLAKQIFNLVVRGFDLDHQGPMNGQLTAKWVPAKAKAASVKAGKGRPADLANLDS